MSRPFLHHVAVRVRDVGQCQRFYEEILGVQAMERPEFGFPGAWYKAGSSEIHLISGEEPTGGAINPLSPHLALEVDDLTSVRRALDAAGTPYLALGDGLLWVRDPDGNTIEVRQPEQSFG